MYHTSKQRDNAICAVHGGQGTFLASVGALSLLSITSRHFQHYSHNTLIMHRAKPISRLTPTPPQHEIRSSTTHGTRVSVRDLFGNMPVRVKQRAINAEEASEVEKRWQTLRTGIVSLLLPWNHRVAITVRDSDYPSRTFSINTSAQFASNSLTERNLNTLNKKTSGFDQSTILSILAQSGLISADSKGTWIPVSASTSLITVRGLISLEPAPSRATQFMSVGITPCLDGNRHNELYNTINRVFNQSSFGHVEDDSELDEAELKRRQHDRRFKKDGLTNKQVQGGRKGIDHWPKFYFRIDLSTDERTESVSALSDVRLKSIVNVLESLATHWLEANHFRPKQKRQKKSGLSTNTSQLLGSNSPAPYPISPISDKRPSSGSRPVSSSFLNHSEHNEHKRSSKRVKLSQGSAPQMPFTDWSRIKSAKPQMYEDIWKCKTSRSSKPIVAETGIEEHHESPGPLTMINVETVFANQFGTQQNTSSEAVKDHEAGPEHTSQAYDENGDASIELIDPRTNQKHRINARTGVVMPEAPHRSVSGHLHSGIPAAAADSRMSSFGKPVLLEHRKSTPLVTSEPASTSASASPWLEGFLQTWKNPIFANQPEQAIPTAGFGGLGEETCDSHRHDIVADAFSRAGLTDTSRLSKTALPHAHVISQVDQKFILMRLPSVSRDNPGKLDHSRTLLVLVDQHAASERCILEALLEELCTPDQFVAPVKSNFGFTSTIAAEQLEKPLHFQVPFQEEAMFRAHAQHFANWGILYDLHIKTTERPRLKVLTLPPIVSERCKLEPKLVLELLRGEIYALAETSGGNIRARGSQPAAANEKHAWLRRLGSCPKGLLQLLNSRACRSAVMFNDKLSVEECQNLMERLAGCAFPFMCAHGRNSMVPLVYLDGDEEKGSGSGSLSGFGTTKDQEGSFASAYKEWRRKKQG